MLKKTAYAGLAGTLMSAALAVAAPSAQAGARDGVCESGEFCLYYNSDHQGSVSDFVGSISDYGATQPECYEFKGVGAGQGLCVKNNAASAWNRTTGAVTVYYNSGYAGANQTITSGGKVNLSATLKNQNASHKSGGTTTPTSYMSYSLYSLTGGLITAGFDGYGTTRGRHEGIDIDRGIGSPVRALVGGQVVNIVRGARGSGGLSTIAIYNAAQNKTVIYLHSAPLSGLYIGQTIARNQQIATEDWRGVSSSSASHTHVEMRLGRQTSAAKSVNDWTLDNPDPTTFWNANGYVEK